MRVASLEASARIALIAMSCGALVSCGDASTTPGTARAVGEAGSPPAVSAQVSLSSSVASVRAGESYTLNWSTSGTSLCSASGDWSGSLAPSGSRVVTADSTGTKEFVIECTTSGGRVARSISVVVTGRCDFDRSVYETILTDDGIAPDEAGRSAVIAGVATRPTISGQLLNPAVREFSDIKMHNASIFTSVEGFDSAYDCLSLRIPSPHVVEHAPGILEIPFSYHQRDMSAFVYGSAPATCNKTATAALVIPGSGDNQGYAIYTRDPANPHFGAYDGLRGLDDVFVLIKPNEDALAWHDGGGQKLSGDVIWNWHLNRGGSYGVSYLVQAMSVMRWLRDCYKRTAVVGLSQGGAASMLVSLQSSPDLTIVAAGHSLLLGDVEWSGPNQLVGVPGYGRLATRAGFSSAIASSSSSWLFAWGLADGDVYGTEARTQITASAVASLPNVEVAIHQGGHVFPIAEMQSFVSSHLTN